MRQITQFNAKEMKIKQFGDYTIREDGMIIRPTGTETPGYTNRKGYYKFKFFNVTGRKYRTLYVHRLVAHLFNDFDLENSSITIDHLDGDKDNNHYSNLEACTNEENIRRARGHALPACIYVAGNKNRFIVRLMIDKKRISKTFDTIEEALVYRDATRVETMWSIQ